MTEHDYSNFHSLVEQLAIPTDFRVVNRIDGINFVIRTKEKGHNTPHIHLEASNINLSISIEEEPRILEASGGRLSPHKINVAKDWVKDNLEMLQRNWNELTDGVKIPL